jgi:hypothetical protein
MTVQDTETPTAANVPTAPETAIDYHELEAAYKAAQGTLEPDSPVIRIGVDLPASVAVALKHRTNGALDIAETISLIAQLYKDAPLSPGVTVLTSDQHARICGALGFSPQDTESMIGGIEELVRISFGGVRIKMSAEEVGIVNARNASGLSNREWAEQIFRTMFEAWINGVIG